MNFSEIFEYSELSPSGLIWKINIWSGKSRNVLRVAKGTIAGSNKGIKGYWRVIHNKKSYSTHRIIWEMFYGIIPKGKYIDHIDRNKSNNTIENLRLVTNEVNKRNSSKYSNNTSGKTGVRRILMGGVLYWCATWSDCDYKRRTSYFSTVKYGEKAYEMACSKRDQEIKRLNSEGAGYSDTHGY